MNQKAGIPFRVRNLWTKYHWPILAAMGFLSTLIEFIKVPTRSAIFSDALQTSELLIQGLIIPVLLLTLQKTEEQKNVARHLLSLHDALVYELGKTQNWDELIEIIGQFSQRIIPVSGLCLLMQSPGSDQSEFEFVRIYNNSLQMVGNPNRVRLNETECCGNGSNRSSGLRVCNCRLKLQIQENISIHQRYCLPICADGSFLGLLHLYIPVSYQLSQDQKAFLEGIVPEIVMSIKNANLKLEGERREAAFETERLRLASDLHDTLGQDLAYLRNKIEQKIQSLATGEAVLKEELDQMYVVAEEANQTVRNILAVTRSNQGSSMSERLLAYSKAIGERAKLDITIESHGNDHALKHHMQYQIFLIFREILANIERHANARRVEITLNWSDLELAISVNDDGHGFLTDHLDQRDHFGLTIIETRVRELNGHLALISAPDQGTQISFRIPIG